MQLFQAIRTATQSSTLFFGLGISHTDLFSLPTKFENGIFVHPGGPEKDWADKHIAKQPKMATPTVRYFISGTHHRNRTTLSLLLRVSRVSYCQAELAESVNPQLLS